MIQVEHIAHLARLLLSKEEEERFSLQLGSILDYVAKLNELDTSGVEPTAHVLDIKNITREDTVRAALPLDEALANAPDRSGSLYRVPKIIE